MKALKLICAALLLNFIVLSCSSNEENNDNDILCEEAFAETISAAQAFNDATDDNYAELCEAYKNALQAQILACGDVSGDLHSIIADLGDCTLTTD